MNRDLNQRPNRQTTVPNFPLSSVKTHDEMAEANALAIVWSREDPGLLGSLIQIPSPRPGVPSIFGRGIDLDPTELLFPIFQRPGELKPAGLPESLRISRAQLRIHMRSDGDLTVENIGRCILHVNKRETSEATVRVGDMLELKEAMLLLCIRRPYVLPSMPWPGPPSFGFGEPDDVGLVGESPLIWEQRRQTYILGRQMRTHVLILGASGAGKELAAQAIHKASPQGDRKLISRNAATLPSELIDAELVGNLKNYPNPGMPERRGLFGEADGSTLFLDEIGEMSQAMQSHFLRVLDHGEYMRLGESKPQTSRFRLVAATNRPPGELKYDILARLKSQLVVPDLNARREDIPLLLCHLLRQHAAESPELVGPFVRDMPVCRNIRITAAFMQHLIQRDYHTNVRELDRLLLDAIRESRSNYLDLASPGNNARSPGSSQPSPARESGPFTAEEMARLSLQREHAFSPTACGRDPAYSGNRQKADLHLRRLFSKALHVADLDVPAAARLLVGEPSPELEKRVEERIYNFLQNVARRLEASRGELTPEFRGYLSEEYKGYFSYMNRLVEAMQRSPDLFRKGMDTASRHA